MPVLSRLNPTHQLCSCQARKCNAARDEHGVPGKLLDRATYLRHQKAELSRKLREDRRARRTAAELAKPDPDKYGALRKEAAARSAWDEGLEQRLSALSIQDPDFPVIEDPVSPPVLIEHPVSAESRYRIEREQDMANYFSRLEANARFHIVQVQAFETSPTSIKSDDDIQNALRACHNAKGFITDTRQRLSWSEKGHHRRDSNVKEQREAIIKTLSELDDLVQKVESMWGTFLRKREAEVAKMKLDSAAQYNSAHHFEPILGGTYPIVQIVIFMVVVSHVILAYSQRGCRWLFDMCNFIIQTTAMAADPNHKRANYFSRLFEIFPRDVRTATDQFKLDGKATIYAVCTACDATYEPRFLREIPIYPTRCNKQIYGGQCGKLLVRPKIIQGREIFEPIKKYIAFDFHDWVGNLLSRDGYESKMDAAWDKMAPSSGGRMNDIFQGSRILEFKGPDGKPFSETGEKNTGRYLFSLGFDFFNPLRNLAAGKKVSVGVVALVCLNLPIELRYKPENVFLAGIIPGPKEPSLDAVNPYLKPLVNAFLSFWVGVFFTKTSLYAGGRLIICALLLLVADLLAARKAAGFSSCNHEYFCSVCWCTKTAHGYDDFDYKSWKWRTDKDCREAAEAYRTASEKKEACMLFDLSGIRHSELHRLPYFDATRSVVVDPMHNLFLGLIREHFQGILGYGKAKKDLPRNAMASIHLEIHPSADNPLPTKKNAKASVRRLVAWLREPIDFDTSSEVAINDAVSRWNGSKAQVAALVYILKGVGCIPLTTTSQGRDGASYDPKRLTKIDLAKRLVEWRIAQVETDPTELSGLLGRVFTAEEMAELVRDIGNVVKPSWVASIPSTISSNGPKLKSDQWRMAALLYLPVTLVRLWSKSDDDDSSQKYKDLLHLTMSLFSAINVATSRITSGKQADLYFALMVTYRQELKRIFPNYRCHPNHHMALHIPEFIKAYGPVHGWWTFPFERMIGMLQRVPTNYHVGEYEETLGRTWCRRSNLRALFRKNICPAPIQYCKVMFEKLVNPLNRNSLANVIFQEEEEEGEYFEIEDREPKSARLSKRVHKAFMEKFKLDVQQPAESLKGHHLLGVHYTSHHVHEGNSGVLFQGSSVPFQIEEILRFRSKINGDSIWVVAKPHERPQIQDDPYVKYPHLRAKIWATSFADSVQVFPLSAIDSHFAKCIIQWEGKEVAVCVSLSRSQPLD